MTKKIFKDFVQFQVKIFLKQQRKAYAKENAKGMLIIDNFSEHIFDLQEKEDLEKELYIIIKYLKPNTTSLCQPLDLSVNYMIKCSLKTHWINWFVETSQMSSEAKYPNKQNIYMTGSQHHGNQFLLIVL